MKAFFRKFRKLQPAFFLGKPEKCPARDCESIIHFLVALGDPLFVKLFLCAAIILLNLIESKTS